MAPHLVQLKRFRRACWWFGGIAVTILVASLPAVPAVAATNILRNPGFENGRTGWNLGTVVPSPVHSGVAALQIASASTAKTSVQIVGVTGGITYEASGWLNASALAGGARIQVQWRDASNALLRTESIGSAVTGTSGWAQRSASRTAPPTAVQARFVLRVEPEPDGQGQAWFDDLSLAPPETPLPSGFVQDVVTSGLIGPTDLAFLPDGRILIAEHRGVVRVLDGGSLSTFLDIRPRVNNFGERGLLGIAVDPAFTTTQNNFVYLYYSFENDAADPDAPKTLRLSRFTVSGGVADPDSDVVLVGEESVGPCSSLPAGADCIPSDHRDHHGGTIRFASDGTIFLSTGDGTTACCVDTATLRTQDVDSLAGKILHVTRSGAGVPTNPFWNGDAGATRSKVWAYGLRNPFRFSLHPSNGRPFIGDVGWNQWEEIDSGPAGSNFGWPCYEGAARQAGYEPRATCQALYAQGPSAVTDPILAYAHGGTHASVTGGVFYTGSAFPQQYQGSYFYGDYARGWIRHVRFDADDDVVAGPTDFMTAADGPVDIEVAPDGSLMYLSIYTGELRKIRYAAMGPVNQPPTANAQATPTAGSAPLTVQFSSSGSSDPDGGPISYTWTFGDGSEPSSQPSPQHRYTQNGTYEAVLTVEDDEGQSATDRVTINVGNRPPSASIDQPSASFRYVVGETVQLVGSAVDSEQGTLPGTSLSWSISIQHCPGGACHTHPFLTRAGASVSFVAPDHGDDTFFRATLTATDADGFSETAQMDLHPQTVEIRLAAVPTGLQLVYDDSTVTAPFTRLTPGGSTHTIRAPSPQASASFVGWSDGGAPEHTVVTGQTAATYTATFSVGPNLLTNPGFESGRTGWNVGTVIASPVHSGARALLLAPSASAAKTSIQRVAVTGGRTYHAYGWVLVNGLQGGARLQLQWRNASGALLRTDSLGTIVNGTGVWRLPSASRMAPPTATEARFVLRVEPELDASGQAWFDDLALELG